MKTRKQYINGEISHDEYYSQFIDENVIKAVIAFIGKEAIKNSTCEHFNDIPLKHWNSLHGTLGSYCYSMLKEAGDVNATTLGNTVCIAKAAAKIIRKGA